MIFCQARQFCLNPSNGQYCINGSTAIGVIYTDSSNDCPNCPEWNGNECYLSITPTRAPLPTTTTTTTTTTRKPPPPSCFPSTARVSLENGISITISTLQIGDKIQTGMCGYLNALLKAPNNVILHKGSFKMVGLDLNVKQEFSFRCHIN